MKCKYFDCGWCYYKGDVETNSHCGACKGSDGCNAYNLQVAEDIIYRASDKLMSEGFKFREEWYENNKGTRE